MSVDKNLDKWERTAPQTIREAMTKRKLMDTGHLINSVRAEAGGRDGMYEGVVQYNQYGTFQDLGVGRGTSLEDRATSRLLGQGRRRKPFFKSVVAASYAMADAVASGMADTAQDGFILPADFKLRL